MKEFSPTEFLRREVYPKLDAVQSNLLNGLDPKPQTVSGSYPLTCPECKKREAFYYPHGGYINCPRKKECGKATSIWDAMLVCGYSNSEVFSVLCSAAGVQPPRRDQQEQSAAALTSSDVRIGRAIWQITQRLAKDNPAPLQQFQAERGYSDEQIAAMCLGYYSTAEEVFGKLKAMGFSLDEAVDRGYVERDDAKPNALWSSLAGRIIGYWPHPDGDDRLWGRIPVGSGDRHTKKYKFAVSLKKDIPYLFNQRHRTILVCVEGTMDAWALQLAQIWGCAIGGASINSAQAMFLQSKGVTELAHMVDGDHAGWNGAIASIRSCESVGIVTNIIPLGEGMDDADALMRSGQSGLLHDLVARRMNSGLYLALMLRSLYNSKTLDLQAINRIYNTAESLTAHSQVVFDKHAELLGVRPDLRLEAARIFGALIRSGITIDEAVANVRRRTGHIITIEREPQVG